MYCRWIECGDETESRGLIYLGFERNHVELPYGVSLIHKQMKKRSRIAWCYVCSPRLGLFLISISSNICSSPCVCVCACERFLACMCLYTSRLPTGLCDHIPDDMPFRSLVTSAGVSKWQGLFVCVLICSEETGADSRRRQEEGSHNKSPLPSLHDTKCHPSPGCGARPAILLKRADI